MIRKNEIYKQLKLLKLLEKQRRAIEVESCGIAKTYDDMIQAGFNMDSFDMRDAEYQIPEDFLFSKIESLEYELEQLEKGE